MDIEPGWVLPGLYAKRTFGHGQLHVVWCLQRHWHGCLCASMAVLLCITKCVATLVGVVTAELNPTTPQVKFSSLPP